MNGAVSALRQEESHTGSALNLVGATAGSCSALVPLRQLRGQPERSAPGLCSPSHAVGCKIVLSLQHQGTSSFRTLTHLLAQVSNDGSPVLGK